MPYVSTGQGTPARPETDESRVHTPGKKPPRWVMSVDVRAWRHRLARAEKRYRAQPAAIVAGRERQPASTSAAGGRTGDRCRCRVDTREQAWTKEYDELVCRARVGAAGGGLHVSS